MNLTELRARIESLPGLAYEGKSAHWLAHRIKLRERILNPIKGEIQSYPAWFLYWPTIQATMYVGQAPYVQQELDDVLEFYPSDILIPGKFFHEPTTYNGMSTNLIHQAYHLLQYESRLGVRVRELKTIIEFGGGYGAMALIAHRLGFKGKYYIYDYPEFSLLQEYYLSHQGIKVHHHITPCQCDLFIAIHSLNEVDDSLKRWRILRDYPAMSYLFSYNSQWLGLDNHKWFKLIQQKRDDMEWINWSIEHLPGRYYLVGAE